MNNRKKAIFLSALATLVCAAALISAGILPTEKIPSVVPYGTGVYFVCFALVVLLPLALKLLTKRKAKRLNGFRVSEQMAYLDREKQKAREAAEAGNIAEVTKNAKHILRRAKVYLSVLCGANALMLFTFASAVKALHQWVDSAFWTIMILYACALYFVLFFRFFALLTEKPDYTDCVDAQDYPLLYAMAEKAEKACGVRGKIHLFFRTDCTAAIGSVGWGKNREYVLYLGDALADILTEDELYAVFLHEFSHVSAEAVANPQDGAFASYLLYSPDGVPENAATAYLLSYYAFSFVFSVAMFELSATEYVEREADAAAVRLTDPEIFASGLVKIAMYPRYSLIDVEYEAPARLFYIGEQPPEDRQTYEKTCFRKAFEENHGRWFAGFAAEKQGKNASHPILRDRLANVGISLASVKYALPDATDTSAFRMEIRKMITLLDGKIAELNRENYAEKRKKRYLEPLEHIKSFEENGERCAPEEAAPLLQDLCALRRYGAAVALSRRIIGDDTLTDDSRAYPLLWLGTYLLDHDDREGLEYAYRAADANDNAIEGAIEAIGGFCCRNGLEEDYAEYRRRSEVWLQHQRDITEKREGLSSKDRLSAEHFSEEKLNGLLDFIRNAGKGDLKAVYLVHKTVSDDPDGYASPFVLEFREGVSDERIGEVYDAVFQMLDTVPDGWQYMLYVYDEEIGKVLAKVPGSCVWRDESKPQ